MINFDNPTEAQIFGILFGDDLLDRQPLGRGEVLLAHYTTAHAACEIIRSSELWLTNLRRMNDIHEIQYGVGLVNQYFDGPEAARRRSFFATVGLPDWPEFAESLNNPLWSLRHETFVSCLSEHPITGEENGRLSMWRGYGHNESAALLINPRVFDTITDHLGVFSLKVRYWEIDQLSKKLDYVQDSVLRLGIDVIRIHSEVLHAWLRHFFTLLPLSLKHPGFREEQEWRIFHTADHNKKTVVKTRVQSVGGVPQIVKVLPLEDYSSQGGPDISIQSIYAGAIVGPTDSQLLVAEAIDHLLREKGVDDPEMIATLSLIPFRRRY